METCQTATEFHKRRQLFIRTHNETLSVVAMRVSNANSYAKHRSRSHDAVIHINEDVANMIETHEHKGEFKEP